MFDLNNDGQISIDELKKVLRKQPSSPKKFNISNMTPSTMNTSPFSEVDQEQMILDEIVKCVDKDGTNSITFDEFNYALTRYLQKAAQIEKREMK